MSRQREQQAAARESVVRTPARSHSPLEHSSGGWGPEVTGHKLGFRPEASGSRRGKHPKGCLKVGKEGGRGLPGKQRVLAIQLVGQV